MENRVLSEAFLGFFFFYNEVAGNMKLKMCRALIKMCYMERELSVTVKHLILNSYLTNGETNI